MTAGQVLPVKRVASIRLGKMVQPNASSAVDVEAPYLRAAHVQPSGRLIQADEKVMWFSPAELRDLRLRTGDVVVVEGGAGYGRSAYLDANFEGWGFQNSIIRVRPRPGFSEGRFLNYAFQSLLVSGQTSLATSVATIPHYTAAKVANTLLWIPDIATQERIADFLDRETAQIDAMIEAQAALKGRVLERSATARERLIFAGLEPSRALRANFVEWLPDLPGHWEVGKIDRGFTVTLGKMLDKKRQAFADDEETPYIRAANIQDDGLHLDDLKAMPFRARELRRLDLRRGDLLVVEGGSIGTNAYLTEDMPGHSFQKTVNRVRPRGESDGRYLGHVLTVLRDRGVLAMLGNQSTIAHFTAEKLKALLVPFPPADEQRLIADRLDVGMSDTSRLLGEAEAVIALLRERRKALITAAVTGRIDPETGIERVELSTEKEAS